jgi:hypothetical protein
MICPMTTPRRMKDRPAICLVGFPPNEAREECTILSWSTDTEEHPYAVVQFPDKAEPSTVHQSRVTPRTELASAFGTWSDDPGDPEEREPAIHGSD